MATPKLDQTPDSPSSRGCGSQKGSKQYNFALTKEGRRCLEDLMRIMDLSASAVINQALQRLRLSDELRQYEAIKGEVLGVKK